MLKDKIFPLCNSNAPFPDQIVLFCPFRTIAKLIQFSDGCIQV